MNGCEDCVPKGAVGGTMYKERGGIGKGRLSCQGRHPEKAVVAEVFGVAGWEIRCSPIRWAFFLHQSLSWRWLYADNRRVELYTEKLRCCACESTFVAFAIPHRSLDRRWGARVGAE